MRTFYLSSLLLTLPPLALAETICGEEVTTIEALQEKIAASEVKEQKSPDGKFMVYVDEANQKIWNFTTDEHAAHPSVGCRRPEKEGKMVYIRTQLVCGAAKVACDQLRDAYNETDAALQKHMAQQAKAPKPKLCGQNFSSINEQMKAIYTRALPLTAPEDATLQAWKDKDNKTTWFMTKPDHPAHPTLACIYLTQEKSKPVSKVDVACEHADASVCEQFRDTFLSELKTLSAETEPEAN